MAVQDIFGKLKYRVRFFEERIEGDGMRTANDRDIGTRELTY